MAADFDPDVFLAQTTPKKGGGDFDPDAFLKATAPANPKPETSALDAAVRGGAQGILPFMDEITAGVGAAKDALTSPVDYGTAYKAWKNVIRKADQKAKDEHPWTYGASQLAGGVGTAFLPGLGALNAGKDAGIIAAAGKGALAGGLYGAGDSTADATTYEGFKDMLGDAAHGAKWGAAMGAGTKIAGKVAGAVADKLRPAKFGSVMLNVPEESLQAYIDNPAAVNAAKSRPEIVQQFLGGVDNLQNEVTGGSAASRKILEEEGKSIPGSRIADLLQGKSKAITDRLAGINDDPEKLAAAKWLSQMADEYAPKAAEAAETGLLDASGRPITKAAEAADRQIPTNRVKDFLQAIDRQTEFETAPGRFSRIDDATKADARRGIDQLLKGESPAYAEQMQSVAKDADLLRRSSELAKTPQGFENLFKRVQKDRAFFPAEVLGEMDQRMGTSTLQDLKMSMAKEAMDKGYTNGSRAVNLYKEMGGKNPIARAAMGVVGATVDKYGAPIARKMVDKSAQIQSMLQSSEGIQRLGPYAQMLGEAAKKGNQSLAATHFVLSQSDPRYYDLINSDTDNQDK